MASQFETLPGLNPQATSYLEQLWPQLQQMMSQSQQGFEQFLPGGEGGKPIIDQAMKQFNQQTIPDIMNAYGSNSGQNSSALNQALASGGANLSTDLAAKLSEMQMTAAQGMGQLATSNQQSGLANSGMNYMQKQPGFLKQMLLSLLGATGEVGKTGAKAWATSKFRE